MTTASPTIVRLLVATTALSLAALGVGLYGVLRTQTRAVAVIPEEVAALRQDLAELRRSVDLTRSQQSAPGSSTAIADAERRLARIEALLADPAGRPARPATAGGDPSASPSGPATVVADPDRLADGSPRYTSLRAPTSAVKVSQSPDGSLAVTNSDPKLTGQSMVVTGRTADGRDDDVTVTIPPPV